MAKKKQSDSGDEQVVDLRYPGATRKNIPPVGLEARGKVVKEKKLEYAYNPHLPPVLRFDADGAADKLPELLEEAGKRPLTSDEQKMLADALRNHQPWLEWTGKREQQACVVDPVGIHIHERVSAKAILATAARQDIPRSLYADPEQEYREAVQFYQHDVDWSNRLILGDSLSVMASLARREALAGKVQMIYLDPPYGIKYASNFQPEVGKRDVKDKPEDLTREPEMVKAFRDTWNLGVHSYLAYLRDRLALAKELLADTGSIFMQIGDENVHRVQSIMDEIFGPSNWRATITVRKTLPLGADGLTGVTDFLLWYCKDIDKASTRERTLWRGKALGKDTPYKHVQTQTGEIRKLNDEELELIESGADVQGLFRYDKLESSGYTPTCFYDFKYNGEVVPAQSKSWRTNSSGMARLLRTGRVVQSPKGKKPSYMLKVSDAPGMALHNLWADLQGAQDPVYVVQTNEEIILRCMLLCTEPGDLVLDPTCGSGTTAFVAEQRGRRWITIDCSRVALSIARQRLLTSKFDFYKLRSISAEDVQRSPNGTWLSDPTGVLTGSCTFDCRTVPYVTLKSIAQNPALDSILDKWESILIEKLRSVNDALAEANTKEFRAELLAKYDGKKKRKDKEDPITDADERRWKLPETKWEEWQIPFDTDPDYPQALSDAITDYRKAWKNKMDEINACIDARAEQEELVDQPLIDKNILRVCSPFTVEGVIPSEESIDFETESPIGGAPDELDAFSTISASADVSFQDSQSEPQNAEAYVDKIIRLLKADGVLFPNNKHIKFDRLEAYTSPGLHAEGNWTNEAGERTVAVVVAPQYGSLSAKMVEDGIRFAAKRGFDELVFAGFSFDGAAQAAIQEDPDPHLRLHMAQIRPDVNMGDLLKTTTASQIFTVSGTPRTKLVELEDGELQVEMEGVDIYDPVTNTVRSTGAEKVAAWFVDANYDGRCFCITQAFFPDKKAWEKLSKALVGTVDPERFEAFAGTISLPFPKGSFNRVAVKVIDPRGNEVMRVHKVGGGY
jgi:adenine-specific DNA-methyltransferase